MNDEGRWHLVIALCCFSGAVTVADVVSDYTIPPEFYPLIGLVIGALIAKMTGGKK